MIKARKYVYVKAFESFPKSSDLEIQEEDLPPLSEGEYLTEAIIFSVDPYMRAYASTRLELGDTFLGAQVAKVIDSKNPDHPIGQLLVSSFGWRTRTIANEETYVFVLPDFEGLPLSLGVGILGMPGNTAYFGLLEICKPKSGDVVVVTGAAGAVGSIVGQIAKIKECTVIGVAGSDEKGQWLIDDLKFDHFINYKDSEFEKKLEVAAPGGVDCFFDNVGGEISAVILTKMKDFGRVALCGGISGYNRKEPQKVRDVQLEVVTKQLRIEGFVVHRWKERWLEGILQNKEWIKEGKLKYRETVYEGFDNMFNAFVDMLNGVNFGKVVIKA